MGGVASTFAPAGALWGSLYGAGTGSVIGGVGSVMTGGDIKEGIIFGAATRLLGGVIQGYCSAKSQGLNPWTEAKLPETTVNTPNVPLEVQAEMTVAEKATTGGRQVQCSSVNFEDAQFSPKQLNHIYATHLEGKSFLTIDHNILLNDLKIGNYEIIGINGRNMPIVQFQYDNIGIVVGRDGSIIGNTNQATIHINANRQIHIVPRSNGNSAVTP